MTDFKQRLEKLIDDFLDNRLDFEQFQRAYSDCYIDEQADAAFTPEEIEYYGTVHEKAEWTSRSPNAEERGYGWLAVQDFKGWLEAHRNNARK